MTSEYESLRRAGVTGVIKSGIGKADAARAATEFILTEHPDCIINSGCAGGVGAGLNVFDIVIGGQTAYHDVWCGEGNLPGQVQGLPQRFDADPALLRAALSLQTSQPVRSGLICTGDQFLTDAEDDARVLEIYPDANKFSIMMSLPHRPGSLNTIISKFAAINVNLTKLESRPVPGMDFEFRFTFDFEASPRDPNVLALLAELAADPEIEHFTFLGAYAEA